MASESLNLMEKLKILGFMPITGTAGIYGKVYKHHKNYTITVKYDEANSDKSTIDYGKDIVIHRNTISSFNQAESLVVLECVNRLLEKGYKPKNIELEKSWLLGHRDKGFLDIWVKSEDDKSFLMIECKTWGAEFDKFVKETLRNKKKNGGQIFSYLHQEPDTKAVCYYASSFTKKSVDYKNAIIYNQEEWKGLSQEERYNRWSLSFEANGIFEDWVNLYNLESKALLQRDLEPLRKEDSDGIYNKFAEILRHNVVSDKPNAFNKIINLFLCKVYDENRAPDEELKFQIRTKTREKTSEELLEDLNDLYKKGMEEYLQKEVSDYSKDEFHALLGLINEDKREKLEEVYKALRLYKNNEFAFKEVFDKRSFDDNAVVVREVVNLLERKQLRYSHKQQFLGDFFEKLLNDSIKQEAGQFFTPIPLAQFIVKSLPIEEQIKQNIKDKKNDVLPYVIDYACGAGHFLTEAMDEIQNIIKDNIDLEDIKKPSLKTDFLVWKQTQFTWADKYIYGLDLDYRLIKTSKISCFLNGDGLANLIHANGLSPFNSSDYVGVLHNNNVNENNQKFDILIANPPYSVKAFKNTIKQSSESFDLYEYLTEDSSEIECLFVERAKQLVNEKGLVGIVLPVSFLTNGGIYIKAREIILKYFDIKGILSLDNNAFMATGTKTIILFMQRRSNHYWEEAKQIVDKFFDNFKDVAFSGVENIFSKYVSENYDDLSFFDYVSILNGKPSESAKKSELSEDYEDMLIENIVSLEKEKLLYFALSYTSGVVIANSGLKDVEKEFLGYSFSNRKGSEGISIQQDEKNNIISSLYSEYGLDDEKLNYYIYNNFIGNNVLSKIDAINKSNHPLKNHIDFCRLSELLYFNLPKFEKVINVKSKKKTKIESKYKLVKMKNLWSYFSSGVVYSKSDVVSNASSKKILTADNITLNNELIISKVISLKENFEIDSSKKLKKDDIFICLSSGSLSHIGKVAYVNENADYYAGGFMGIIRANDKIYSKYLFNILSNSITKNYFEVYSTGNNINNLSSVIERLRVPLPPMCIQKEISNSISFLEEQEIKNMHKIISLDKKIKNIIDVNGKLCKLSSLVTMIKRGKSPKYGKSDIEMIKSGQVRGLREFDFSKRYYASPSMGMDERLLESGDLLINSTGVGTAGRVGIYNLSGKHFVDSHITILRLNRSLALPEYVLYQLYSNVGFDNIEKMATGQSGQIELSPQTIGGIKISIPSVKEQEKIVKNILSIEKEIDKLKKEIEFIPQKKQAILDKYLK